MIMLLRQEDLTFIVVSKKENRCHCVIPGASRVI